MTDIVFISMFVETRQMEITTLNQVVKYIDKVNNNHFHIRFTQIGLKGDTYKIVGRSPQYLFEMLFTRYISTKGKVLFMCGDEYYTEQELVKIIKNNIDSIEKSLINWLEKLK